MHNLIVGCGDTGRRVAARAVAAGQSVTGVVRSATSAARVRSVGARALQRDLDRAPLSLPACDRLFYCAPPPREGDTDTRMQRVLAGLATPPARAVYISTIGVYGDRQGAWVDEHTPPAPATDRARRRVDAEQRIQAFCDAVIVLRAPGIYGPNRLPIDRVESRAPVVAEDEAGWTNRIHIDDLAALAWRAATDHWPRRLYNVSDGYPTTVAAFYDTLARLLGVAPPPRIGWAEAEQLFSAMRLSFLRESRRIDNRRMLADSGYRLVFADYRDGLAASIQGRGGRY